jgi:ubiquinone/menaquinone biosynthesis C-methylase UbiE
MDVPVARLYDLLNAVLFAPSGGSGRLRQHLVESLALTRGDRVLELGCGTGQVTERLLAAGARVTAVDALPEMLEGARRRAPEADYVVGDAFDDLPAGPFDAVVLSFVLHNLPADRRRLLLARSAALLAPGGTVGVLDWHLPAGRRRAAGWRKVLARIEPAPTVGEVLDGALPADLAAAGLDACLRRPLAAGRAEVLLARLAVRPTAGDPAAPVAPSTGSTPDPTTRTP